ncbi:multisite-specific tRNA:(cytosine-C(5))-methyltransferase [Piromyces finnis]|uniref:Multisite-specific tRNA:(Cytosine-C(5))-methyltransferase n=1 Tax=Piromyces finnis TaxID=1754191 RepID=A0A1Y1V3F8_9FUNG|nr:multisite-specific tRNA:(cytosine-C(5))-methyltransferase [Piromyces finnis]|eukprot:ORX46233.1 multisite-specific tRNA:(cytosine-C(5))-methyltransferase [Piromyces finnis]
MGKGKKFTRRGRRKEWKGDNEHSEKDKNQDFGKRGQYKQIVMENADFENYYKGQNIIPDPEEFKQFIDILKKQLPVTFRITGSRSHCEELRDSMIKNHFSKFNNNEGMGSKPEEIKWYPNGLGWQVPTSRTELRKSAETAAFHKFLVSETEIGNICRQEAVSMIPPLLLNVQPHHYVIDMCAAPGSKTSQIIEALHSQDTGNVGSMPTGLVIANDADYNRSYMLVYQLKRLQSANLIVTNHEAQFFPNIYVKNSDKTFNVPIQFDRVLCDVPCSGDGTLRKNKMIWKSWSPRPGNGLHPLQKQIFIRGCQLLRVGGRIVYSTCSFNPIENEAVVCAVLNECKGSIRLVDVSKELPGLIRRPGMTSWKCAGEGNVLYSSYDEVPEAEKSKFEETMFPPKNVTELNVDRCLRIFPHLQDTGGFFVAVFEKVAPFGSLDLFEKKKTEKVQSKEVEMNGVKEDEEEINSIVENDSKRRKLDNTFQAHKELRIPEPSQNKNVKVFSIEQPFVFLPKDDPIIEKIKEFYGLSSEFPQEQWVVRTEGEKFRTVYFISDSVKSILNSEDSHRILVVNSGVKMFFRNEGDGNVKCSYRIVNEGLNTLSPYLSEKRIINATLEDLRVLLEEDYPHINGFTENTKSALEGLDQGSFVLRFIPSESDNNDNCLIRTKLELPVWKARSSVNLLMKKAEKKSLAWRLLGKELEEKKTRKSENEKLSSTEQTSEQVSSEQKVELQE